ncbi:MAG: hypothetical protein DYH13_09260 [Alphaproteobacteria bacterium PRO2]|nr:hypothetical protein [Alphaproteobacteria bacterium PRO2]
MTDETAIASEKPTHLSDEEWFVLTEAEKIAGEILDDTVRKEKQWATKYKDRAMRLLWKCHLESITPPFGLVILVGLLFGSRQDWPAAKFSVLGALAEKFDPPEKNQKLQRGALSLAARALEQSGGILKVARELDDEKGNDKRRYEQTVKPWLHDPVFLYLWAHKRREALNRAGDFQLYLRENLTRIIKSALSEN